jgi:hypothetical protein
MDKIIEIICQDYFMDLEYILIQLNISDDQVLQALLDQGLTTPEELMDLVNEEEDEETFN